MSEEDPILGYVGPGFYESFVQPCLAEFVCTLIFTLIGSMSAQDGEIISVGLAHGLTIALLIAAFGKISGAHINPAVTLGVCVSGGIPWLRAIFYVISQLLGGITGAAVCRGVMSEMDIYVKMNAGGQQLAPGVSPGAGVLCEISLTFVLVLTILLVAVDTDSCTLAPLAIGFAVGVDILAGANVTGASMNPARSFGPAVVASGLVDLWPNHWVYWVGPAGGALLAALFYRLLFANSSRRLILK